MPRKIKKIVTLKDYSAERFAKNLIATRKLLKKRGYLFRSASKNYFIGNLMLNEHEGIVVRFKGLTSGDIVEVQNLTFSKKTNTFYVGYCMQTFQENQLHKNQSWINKYELGVPY